MPLRLILGGARSGKSAYAEQLVQNSGFPVLYIATAPVIQGDDDWQARIEKHKARRPKMWTTVEEPLDIVAVLQAAGKIKQCVLVDCLSLWLSNVLFAKRDVNVEIQLLCEGLSQCQHELVLVSNELGMGLVPDSKLGRDFRDAQGVLNQHLAKIADHVQWVVAGLPLTLK